MTEEHINQLIEQNEQSIKEDMERLGFTDKSKYDKYMESLAEEEVDYEALNETWNLYNSIEMLLEQFDELTEEEQDFFKTLIEVRIKQRNPNYDIYADEELEQSLHSRFDDMEEMLKKLLNKKEVNVDEKRVLSVEDFEKKYGMSRSTQQRLRGQGLPILKRRNSSEAVKYDRIEVERWFENRKTSKE